MPTANGDAFRIELVLLAQYREQPDRTGRIAYEVGAQGKSLFRQDVAAWNPENHVWIAMNPQGDSVEMEVRLVALQDCEDWHWGPMTPIRLEAARRLPWSGSEELVWGASRLESTRSPVWSTFAGKHLQNPSKVWAGCCVYSHVVEFARRWRRGELEPGDPT